METRFWTKDILDKEAETSVLRSPIHHSSGKRTATLLVIWKSEWVHWVTVDAALNDSLSSLTAWICACVTLSDLDGFAEFTGEKSKHRSHESDDRILEVAS